MAVVMRIVLESTSQASIVRRAYLLAMAPISAKRCGWAGSLRCALLSREQRATAGVSETGPAAEGAKAGASWAYRGRLPGAASAPRGVSCLYGSAFSAVHFPGRAYRSD